MTRKILVIEDEQSLRKDIMEMLNYEGFQMIGAENGLIGVQKAREHLPDLIICDIMMPELNGYDVLAELRRYTETATIPFIFLTARTDKHDRRLGMEQGADDYLTKPFTVTELFKSVRVRLEKRDALAQLSERRMDELRDNIILSMPHELRTPLTVILGFSEVLLSEPDLNPKRTREMIQHINKSALRLYHLIENYLVYAQVETMATDERLMQRFQDGYAESPHLVIEAAAIEKARSYEREQDLCLKIAPVTGLRILEDNLRKIVEEVVDNALKFSPDATPVQVRGEVDDRCYVIRVTDHGRGMTPAEIRAVGAYMQFNRRIHEQQGSGLGLVIARRLAELHKGSLKIESVPEVETVVTVKLPVA